MEQLKVSLEREVLMAGHDVIDGWMEYPVLGRPFLRLECRACKAAVCICPDTGKFLFPSRLKAACPGPIVIPDLKNIKDDLK